MAETLESLRAELEKLKLENARLLEEAAAKETAEEDDAASKAAPDAGVSSSLRARVPLDVIFRTPETFLQKEIAVAGWIRSSRKAGGGAFAFVKLDDGTTPTELQLFVGKDIPGFQHINNVGAALLAEGQVVESQGKEQAIELKATKIELLGACPPATYPLAGKGHSLRFLRTVAHLRPRTKAIASVARIRNALSFAVHAFFQAQNFMYIHTPLITTSDCEGGGEMFQVTTLLPEPEKLPAEEEKKSGPLTGGGGGFKKQDVSLDYAKDFFKRPAFLTVSGQLNVETYCQALSNVYTFGPTFRAEVSHTTRHLAEFWMIEPELAFADLRDVMENAEAFLKFCISEALKRCPEDLAYLEEFEKKQEAERLKEERAEAKRIQAERAAFFKEQKRRQAAGEELLPDPSSEQQQQQQQAKKKKKKRKKPKQAAKSFKSIPLRERLAQVIGQPFARITYTEAIQRLQQAVEENEVEFEEDEITWGMDLASEHEKYLCEQVFKRPLIVRDYPKGIKAFYMRMNPDGDTVAAMDILVPGLGEIIGGSQREERLELLQDRMQDMGIQAEDYEWYLDLRRYGSVPHSGFGLGFERLVCYVTGMDNIRDVIPFPRTVGHAEF